MTRQKANEVKSALQESYEKEEAELKEQAKEYASLIKKLAREENVNESLVEACKSFARKQGFNFDKDLASMSLMMKWERENPNWEKDTEELMERSSYISDLIEEIKEETKEKISTLKEQQQELYTKALHIGSIGAERSKIEKIHSHLFRD
jgi:sugar-specific transcriptional regulator TrmB